MLTNLISTEAKNVLKVDVVLVVRILATMNTLVETIRGSLLLHVELKSKKIMATFFLIFLLFS